MIVEKVTLKNFMCHAESTFNFSRGVNSIIGPNGSGKTSVVLAISMVLIGASDRNANALIKHGAGESDVELVVKNPRDGRRWRIARKFGSVPSISIYDEAGDASVNLSVGEGLKYIRDISGPDGIVDSSLVFLYSSSLIHPFMATPTFRKKWFDNVLDIDKYERVWHGLREPISNISKRMEKSKGAIDQLEYALELTEKVDVERVQEELAKAKRDLELLFEREGEDARRREVLKELVREVGVLSGKVNSLKADVYRHKNAILTAGQEIEHIKKKVCPYCGAPLSDEKAKEEARTAEKKLKELRRKLRAAGAKKDNIESSLSSKRKKIGQIELSLDKKLADKILSATEKVKELELRLVASVTDRERIVKLNERLADLRYAKRRDKHRLNTLKSLRDGFRTLPNLLNKEITSNISNLATEICGNIIGKPTRIFINTTYETYVHIGNNDVEFAHLSGGQKAAVALSIKIAIASLLTNQDLLILDEPTINLDDTAKTNLSQQLDKLGFKQLILITHDHIFEADNTIILGE